MAEYAFLSVWEVEAPVGSVWKLISAPEGYPSWFRYVTEVRKIVDTGDAHVGTVIRSTWKTALPYSFTFESETTRFDEPCLIELRAGGELEGTGRWLVLDGGRTTTVQYEWRVRTTKPWMVLVAPVLRPLFAWNHAILMQAGGTGLADKLGTTIVRNESFSRDSTNLATPTVAILGLGSLLRSLAKLLLGRSAHDS